MNSLSGNHAHLQKVLYAYTNSTLNKRKDKSDAVRIRDNQSQFPLFFSPFPFLHPFFFSPPLFIQTVYSGKKIQKQNEFTVRYALLKTAASAAHFTQFTASTTEFLVERIVDVALICDDTVAVMQSSVWPLSRSASRSISRQFSDIQQV